ncbi:MAG: hypothetical protein M1840_001743 [Geoglossum simile]|nr:MAG: hypothetical protein M1840_001743 [Geoglossum simile]
MVITTSAERNTSAEQDVVSGTCYCSVEFMDSWQQQYKRAVWAVALPFLRTCRALLGTLGAVPGWVGAAPPDERVQAEGEAEAVRETHIAVAAAVRVGRVGVAGDEPGAAALPIRIEALGDRGRRDVHDERDESDEMEEGDRRRIHDWMSGCVGPSNPSFSVAAPASMATVTSIITVTKLVAKFHASSSAPSNYSTLRGDVEAFDRALADARPALLQRGKNDVYDGCAKIIADIRGLLARHSILTTDHKGIRDRVGWRFAATRLPELTERLKMQLLLLNLAVNSPIPDGLGIGKAVGVVYGVDELAARVLGGSLGQELDGEAIDEVNGVVGQKLHGGAVHEIGGTLGHEVDGGAVHGRDKILRHELGSMAVYEMSGTLGHELDSVAVYEMSGSVGSRSIRSPRTPTDSLSENGAASQLSSQRESMGSLVDLLECPDSPSGGATDASHRFGTFPTAAPSQRSLSSRGSSFASTDFRQVSACKIDKGDNDVATVLRFIKSDVGRFQQDQESANRALIALSKHGPCEPGQIRAMHVLLDQCAAEVEYRDKKYSRTPLIWAASVGREDTTNTLLDHCAAIEARDEIEHCTPLIWAVCHGHEAVAQLLIRRGASLESTDHYWLRTPLLWAAKRGAFQAVKMLLAEIHDPRLVDAQDKDGKTALALAYTEHHPVTARALLEHGADPNFVFRSGRPLLVSAVLSGDEALVRLLVGRGADVQCRNLDGVPALSIAVYDKPLTLVQFLVDSGADLDYADPEGRTPLIWAIKRCRENVVELLVRRGAITDVADREGRTAQYWAKKTQDEKIIYLVG